MPSKLWLIWILTVLGLAMLAATYVSGRRELAALQQDAANRQALLGQVQDLRQKKATLADRLCRLEDAEKLKQDSAEAATLRRELQQPEPGAAAPAKKLPLQPGITALADIPLADPGTGMYAFTKAARALAQKDAKALSECMVLDRTAKALADKLLEDLDPDLRAGIGSGEKLCALYYLSYYGRVEGAQILGQNYRGTDYGTTQVRMQTRSGTVHEQELPVRRVNGEWKISLGQLEVIQASRQLGLNITNLR